MVRSLQILRLKLHKLQVALRPQVTRQVHYLPEVPVKKRLVWQNLKQFKMRMPQVNRVLILRYLQQP